MTSSGFKQSLRSSSDGSIIEIEALWDIRTDSHIVLWKQIEAVFDRPKFVRHGLKHVFFMLDENFEEISPYRIAYHPGVVLDVYDRENTATNARTTSTICTNTAAIAAATTADPERGHAGPLENLYTEIQPQPSAINSSINMNSPRIRRKPNLEGLSSSTRSSLMISTQLYESFLDSVSKGQLTRADSMKAEFRQYFTVLQNELGEHRDLQEEMRQMMATMLDLQRQANERLIAIQHGIRAILTQTYELLEYPIPRLFIVLRQEKSRLDVLSPFTEKFRLW
ncbi:hypothetical protein BGZ83_007786 [Gryganskiella cystojenkinii]|nr:hypothetical protein BGZ83_007786 [Gryganskiella cystojenkinii]